MDERPVGLDRAEGRRLYGRDPSGYDAGRPDYPSGLYDVLEDRCRARADARVLEIGPGTGRVTRRLLALGAKVTAVEPNADIASWLADRLTSPDLQVIVAPFEDAGLPTASFDLAVAATSFHWVQPDPGLVELRRVLRPGAWLASCAASGSTSSTRTSPKAPTSACRRRGWPACHAFCGRATTSATG